jgi:hypothetical protein
MKFNDFVAGNYLILNEKHPNSVKNIFRSFAHISHSFNKIDNELFLLIVNRLIRMIEDFIKKYLSINRLILIK